MDSNSYAFLHKYTSLSRKECKETGIWNREIWEDQRAWQSGEMVANQHEREDGHSVGAPNPCEWDIVYFGLRVQNRHLHMSLKSLSPGLDEESQLQGNT